MWVCECAWVSVGGRQAGGCVVTTGGSCCSGVCHRLRRARKRLERRQAKAKRRAARKARKAAAAAATPASAPVPAPPSPPGGLKRSRSPSADASSPALLSGRPSPKKQRQGDAAAPCDGAQTAPQVSATSPAVVGAVDANSPAVAPREHSPLVSPDAPATPAGSLCTWRALRRPDGKVFYFNATTGVAQSTPPQELVKLNGTASAVVGEAIGKPTAATPSTPNGYLLYVPHDTPASS